MKPRTISARQRVPRRILLPQRIPCLRRRDTRTPTLLGYNGRPFGPDRGEGAGLRLRRPCVCLAFTSAAY